MTQTSIDFSKLRRPTAEILGFKPGSQNARLYSALTDGPVSNGQIVYGMRIANSTGRVSDIRRALRPYLMDVEAVKDEVNPSLVVYRLVG